MSAFGKDAFAKRAALEDALVMLVDDREDDLLIIQHAFKRAKLNNPFVVVRDGEEAIQYLEEKGLKADRAMHPLPRLMLLDLKMPRVGGFEVLRWIRTQKHLADLIVVVLTSSNQIRDVNDAYKLGANSFLVKPDDFKSAQGLATMLRDYWIYGSHAPGNVPPSAG